MFRFFGAFILLLSSLQISASDILSKLSQQPQFLPVKEAFVFDFAQQGAQVKLSWQIADGYYLYKDKFKIAGVAVNFSHPTYPVGLPYEDEFFGKTEIYRHQVILTVPLANIDADARLKIRFQGCADAGLCYPVETVEVPLSQLSASSSGTTPSDTAGEETNSPTGDTAGSKSSAPISQQTELAERLNQDRSFWTLGLFFLLGLGLAFTPCVFPMYPILTSIIVGQGQQLSSGRAFTLSLSYVQGMALTYSLLGLVVASAGVQFQAYFQHPAVLVVISLLFVLLALAMFGVINLQLPSSWQAKINQLSHRQQGGRARSAFLMGALSGLVASPCTTAPLTGVLLYIAQTGDLAYGALVLYVLSLGMGLPLLILGATGGKFLPKPGAWMDRIKALFGFLLLSVPLVLLERIVPDHVLVVLLSLLLLAFAMFVHHTQQHVSKAWIKSLLWLIATVLVVSTLIMNQRVWWPQPQTTSTEVTKAAKGNFIDIKTLDDLSEQLAIAKAEQQVVLLDFFAEWCIACKEFEEITFVDTGVQTEMAKIRLLRIDVTKATEQDQQVLEEFKVLGLPTILFFTPDGEELTASRITGFMPPAEFQAHLAALNQPQ